MVLLLDGMRHWGLLNRYYPYLEVCILPHSFSSCNNDNVIKVGKRIVKVFFKSSSLIVRKGT